MKDFVCTICFESSFTNEDVILPCGHQFHGLCIYSYFRHVLLKKCKLISELQCPLCRHCDEYGLIKMTQQCHQRCKQKVSQLSKTLCTLRYERFNIITRYKLQYLCSICVGEKSIKQVCRYLQQEDTLQEEIQHTIQHIESLRKQLDYMKCIL